MKNKTDRSPLPRLNVRKPLFDSRFGGLRG